MPTTKKVNELDSIGNIQEGDKLVGERVDGTTVRITFNGVVVDSDLGAGVQTALGQAVTGTGSIALSNGATFVAPVLGTPASGDLSNCTSYPVAQLSGLGSGIATFLATPSSANLRGALTDETGTGAAVFADTPTLVTPNIGAATGTSLAASSFLRAGGNATSAGYVELLEDSDNGSNKVTIIAPASVASDRTATLPDATGTFTLLGNSSTGSGNVVLATSPTLTTPVLGAASATSLTFSSTSGIIGTTTNDSAAAGSVGQYMSSTVDYASRISLTTATAANITSLSLTAGDWLVTGNIVLAPNSSTTISYTFGWISATSASFPADHLIGGLYLGGITSNSSDSGVHVPVYRFSLASTTTVYLSTQCAFGVSTMGALGFIEAWRIR